MFGRKRFRVARPVINKEDLNKAILRANERVKAETDAMNKALKDSKAELKNIQHKSDQANDSLSSTASDLTRCKKETDTAKANLYKLNEDLSKLNSKLLYSLGKEDELNASVNILIKKESKLEKSVSILENKKTETKQINSDLKSVKGEFAEAKSDLSKLSGEIQGIKTDIKAINYSKEALSKEYDTYAEDTTKKKLAIKKAVSALEDGLKLKQDEYNEAISRMDILIAERVQEEIDLKDLVSSKENEYIVAQAKIIAVENKADNAEKRTELAIKRQEDKIDIIKANFKKWKIVELDKVAKLKLKDKIENIDKVGLGEIFNG